MRWELKSRALERGITTSAALRRSLASHGLVISAGKMSGPARALRDRAMTENPSRAGEAGPSAITELGPRAGCS
ncbi:hypothetical protein GCM10023335_75540 [Streptomyces siamensis]|uniref:Uncharacterized protein n=1 Tax=Streptomyces siamensis TaxID=1274986 RepID=A0ABP9JJR7_9ACTN